MDVASATKAIIEAGLVPVLLYQASNTVPYGAIISQFPAGGTVVTEGTQQAKVFLTVSNGPQAPGTVIVPTLTGFTIQAAYQALLASGLSTGYLSWQVSSQPEATVISQTCFVNGSPVAPGGSVPPGTMVTLQVSAGPVRPPLTATVPTVT